MGAADGKAAFSPAGEKGRRGPYQTGANNANKNGGVNLTLKRKRGNMSLY